MLSARTATLRLRPRYWRAVVSRPVLTEDSRYRRLRIRMLRLLCLQRLRRLLRARETPVDLFPVYVLHKRVHVFRRRRAVVHLIRVFVHIHRQERPRKRRVMHVIPCPVIVQIARVEVEREDHPAGTAAERIAGALELGLPLLVTTKCFLCRPPAVRSTLSGPREFGEIFFGAAEGSLSPPFFRF